MDASATSAAVARATGGVAYPALELSRLARTWDAPRSLERARQAGSDIARVMEAVLAGAPETGSR